MYIGNCKIVKVYTHHNRDICILRIAHDRFISKSSCACTVAAWCQVRVSINFYNFTVSSVHSDVNSLCVVLTCYKPYSVRFHFHWIHRNHHRPEDSDGVSRHRLVPILPTFYISDFQMITGFRLRLNWNMLLKCVSGAAIDTLCR